MNCCLCVDQYFMDLSSDAESKFRPSGENVTDRTAPV